MGKKGSSNRKVQQNQEQRKVAISCFIVVFNRLLFGEMSIVAEFYVTNTMSKIMPLLGEQCVSQIR